MLSPSKQCKAAGLKSFIDAVRLSGVPYQTLMDWYKNKPKQFECMIAGAVAIKQNNFRRGCEEATEESKRKTKKAYEKWLLLEGLSDADRKTMSALINKLWSIRDLYRQGGWKMDKDYVLLINDKLVKYIPGTLTLDASGYLEFSLPLTAHYEKLLQEIRANKGVDDVQISGGDIKETIVCSRSTSLMYSVTNECLELTIKLIKVGRGFPCLE